MTPRARVTADLTIATFGILALELALIRWMSGQIRIVAYFQNFVLIAAFLGMGLGVALGKRRPALARVCLPLLAALSILLAYSDDIGVMYFRFPDPSVSLWGGDTAADGWAFARATLAVVALFWVVVAIFVGAGAYVGALFAELPPLVGYSADLIGSLAGVIVLTALAALGTPPPVWIAAGTLPFVWLARRSRVALGFAALAAVAAIVLAAISIRGALFSPYNRLDIGPLPNGKPTEWQLNANRDFHQNLLDLSHATEVSFYELPYLMHARGGSALVVGAGTGNDIAAALRRGYGPVVGVEIDPEIQAAGRRLHPEQPYSNPHVIAVVNDARAWFERNEDVFDVVAYGYLDSHAMFSAMSSLRLDNYVYTLEGLRAGWQHVRDGGVLSVSFFVASPWMLQRLAETLREATGLSPIIVMRGGVTVFMVGRDVDVRRLPPNVGNVLFANRPIDVRVPTDDWPFLYLRPGVIPWAYITVFGTILVMALFAIRGAFGRVRFDWVLFFMGAAFLLLETRMVTALGLLFGSTWVVSAITFAGVLSMVLAANVAVSRRAPRRIAMWFAPLLVALIVIWAIPPGLLNELSLAPRAVVAALLYASPVAFAGIVFSGWFARADDPAGALGANLSGAVVGGILEYASMALGLRAMLLVAIALYVAAFVAMRRALARG